MSLLNDALRKKKSERTAVRMATAPDGSVAGLMSRGRRQWIIVSCGVGLLVVASAVWLILCASPLLSGNSGVGSKGTTCVTRATGVVDPQSTGSALASAHSVPPAPTASSVAIAAAPEQPANHVPETRSPTEKPDPSPERQSSTRDPESSGAGDGGGRKHADTVPTSGFRSSQEQRKPEPRKSVSDTAREEPPGESDPLFQRACRLHRRHELDQAIALYRAVLKEKPDHTLARSNLVAAYLQTGAYRQAYPIAARLFSEDPANQQNMLNLAIAHIGCGRYRQALALLDKAAKMPDAPLFEITFHKAMALGHLGRTTSALACYRRAENMRPDDPDLLFNMALACDQQQQYGAAVNYYLRYLEHALNKDTAQIRQIRRRVRILQAYGAEEKTPMWHKKEGN